MKIKSYVLLYWLYLIILYVGLYIVWQSTILDLGWVIFFDLIATYIMIAVILSYESCRFLKYLQKNHPNETKLFNTLTTGYNIFPLSSPSHKWLRSKEDFGDANVR